MGLLMAHTIIEAYGGTLAVIETGVDGTTIVIRLPVVGAGRQEEMQ